MVEYVLAVLLRIVGCNAQAMVNCTR